jgi:cell wall-associated NlpC family hydrolase
LATALLAVSALAAALIPASAANASPSNLSSPAGPFNESSQDLQQQIDQKGKQLDGVIEQYNLLNVTLGKTKAQAAQVAAQLAPIASQVDAASAVVDALATKEYEGSAVSRFSALLTAGSPDALVDRLNTLNVLSRSQQQDIATLQTASKALQDQKTKLDNLVAQQTNQEKQLTTQKTSIEAQLTSLKQQQAQVDQSSSSSSGSSSSSSSAGSTASSSPPTNLTGAAAKVVAYAYAQLGKPYVFAAAGPNTFDCSGLVLAAWATVGVHLSHSSYTQMNQETTPISRSQLQPGDLVFFYGGEHVGIYIGNNSVIHAPQPGEVVKISTIDWMGGYTASGRPG